MIKGPQNQNDVSKWQFILFIGDHGELGLRIAINKTVPAGGVKTKVATKKKTLNKSQQLVDALQSDPDAQPGFTAFASFAGQNYALQRQPGGIARQVNTYRTKPPVSKFLVVLAVVLGVFLLWMLWRLRLRKP